ncbi:hypothetical protein BOTBODRAFT_484992 [Botryobasidium botryosum FD-172 SS1]|uniref:DNL-type domain-containing protein n=1 Tax=Botryobasidium botryosum (strain FD-172 SS1) TaxID=930990 RepID=A0A067MWR0_BOTB1|nr:hypothetical protein BOTBODRAFT_484992 [Botryobasidium botryosum FD-172 SS1]
MLAALARRTTSVSVFARRAPALLPRHELHSLRSQVAAISFQSRVAQSFQSQSRSYSATPPPSAPTVTTEGIEEIEEKIEPRLSITFTCTVPDCNSRSTHEFTKRSYERGIVIVQCPSCKNRHLIADHLGWFPDTDGAEGPGRTIEDFMRAKGEKVKRGSLTNGSVIEYEE